MLTRCSLLAIFLAFASLSTAVGQPASKGAVAQKPGSSVGLTNQDVVDLVKAGFGDDVVLARIKQSPVKSFDLSTKALVELKTAGVSQRVIAVMLGGPDPGVAQPATPTSESQQVAVSLAAPATRSAEGREAGIYLVDGDKLIPLEPTVFSGGKSGGLFTSALTYGIKKAKWKAVIRSPRAQQRVAFTNPVFYFYFERQGSGLSNTGAAGTLLGASSPNEFVLARMASKSKERELVVGEFGAFGGSTGTKSEDTVELGVERVSPGVYKVTPKSTLAPGEYCFFYAAGASTMMAAGSGKLFDFGVDTGATNR